ncbi:MAG: adenylosuccinate lyase, partial [Zetaproteobacteria bacterium]
MIPRYSRPKMAAIWEPANRFAIWLKIEVLACEAWAELGVVPKEAVAEIKAKAPTDMTPLVPRIDEIERRTRHDVVAFTEAIAERIGPASRYIHLGLTSSDVLDTCLACQMQQAADLLLEDVAALEAVLAALAVKHKRTPMIGRTHGIHAEPTTFGLKLAMWLVEVRRATERLTRARE